MKQVDEGAGVSEERVGGSIAAGDFVGFSADYFFERFAVAGRKGEEFLDEEQMEEFLFDFGVHEYFVGHV